MTGCEYLPLPSMHCTVYAPLGIFIKSEDTSCSPPDKYSSARILTLRPRRSKHSIFTNVSSAKEMRTSALSWIGFGKMEKTFFGCSVTEDFTTAIPLREVSLLIPQSVGSIPVFHTMDDAYTAGWYG